MNAIDKKLAFLKNLEPNWDSYGAPKIDADCIAWVRARLYADPYLREFDVIPCVDGGVQLERYSDWLEIEISVSPGSREGNGHE